VLLRHAPFFWLWHPQGFSWLNTLKRFIGHIMVQLIAMNATEWLLCQGEGLLDYEALPRERPFHFKNRLEKACHPLDKGVTAGLEALMAPFSWRPLPVLYRCLPYLMGREGYRYVRRVCYRGDYFYLPFQGGYLAVEVISAAYPLLWRISFDYTHAAALYLYLALREEERRGRAPVVDGLMVSVVAADPALVIYHPEGLQYRLKGCLPEKKRYAGA